MNTIKFTSKYYFGVCSISGDVLLDIIIGVSVFVAVAIVVTILAVSKARQNKLKKLVEKAEKQADREIGEMIDIRDPNALFKLWQEEVSWEDEFERNSATDRDGSDSKPASTVSLVASGADESSSDRLL